MVLVIRVVYEPRAVRPADRVRNSHRATSTLRRGARAVALALTCASVIAVAATCTPKPPVKPNVVLIVIDTLRADHLGAYGYGKPTSPHLDALAREGVRFANARSTSSWTLPSVASLLTGLYPAAHGAERNTAALGTTVPLLSEAFHNAGYLTVAFSANPAFVTPLQGFARGFDEFTVLHGPPTEERNVGDTTPSDPWLRSNVEVSRADAVTDAALRWIGAHDAAPAPYLLYLHYFDPHAGYFPPPDYATRFGVAPDDPLRGAAQWKLLLSFHAPENNADTATLMKLYDAEIAYADEQIGRFVAGLRERTARPTYFVVVADHGEEFNDHGGIQHGRTLFDELLRVPFIVVGPGLDAGRVVRDPVSLVSLWPTLAELVGVAPPPKADGPGLIELLHGQPAQAANVFADLEARFPHDEQLHHRAIVSSGWKLLVAPDRSSRIFDLASDPLEQIGAIDAESRTDFLRTILKVHETSCRTARAAAPPATVSVTPEWMDQLKALGDLR